MTCLLKRIKQSPASKEMRPRLTGLENSHNNGRSSVPAMFVLNVFATPQEGSQLGHKHLMICFDWCNKWMTGPKSSARVGKEGVTERAWVTLSQDCSGWKGIQSKGTSMHQVSTQERTSCLRNDKELCIC